ncbi:hypothetical protein [Niveibacterium terrae]|uniref:hypothetical protein n=1 Tax=Niveibacterium terrae TaxID=3373598 RepID=UPI003A94376F
MRTPAFPKEDRRLTLAFFLAVSLHFFALLSGPAEHHGQTGSTKLSARLNPLQTRRPAEASHDDRQDAPKPPSHAPSDAKAAELKPTPESRDTSAQGKRSIAIPGLPAPYFSPLDLTQSPSFGEDIPEFLPLAISQKEGRVILVIYLDENGVIDRVESSSEGAEMSGAVRYLEQLVRSTPIKPGEIDGEPVRTRWVIEFSISPGSDDTVGPSASAPLSR